MKNSREKNNFKTTIEKNSQFSISNGWLYVDRRTAEQHPLFGSSGWISFFWLFLFVSPFMGVLAGIEKFSIQNGEYTDLILFIFFINFCLLFLAWLLASDLANPEPQSINFIFIYLICAALLFFITASVVINMAYSSYSQIDKLLVLHLARDAIFLTVLSFYFTLSDRVNITYLHRTKVGSIFAESLKLTLSETSPDAKYVACDEVNGFNLDNKNKEQKDHQDNITTESIERNSNYGISALDKKEASTSDNFFSRLFALKKVLDDGLINEADYEEKKKSIINDL